MDSKPLLARRRELFTSDPDEIANYLRDVYDTEVCVRLIDRQQSASPRLSHQRVEWRGFALEDVDHDADVAVHADVTPGVVVVWALSGRLENTVDGGLGVAGPGQVVVASTGSSPVRLRMTQTRFKSTVLGPQLFDRAAADRDLEAAQPIRFTGVLPVNAAAARAWTRAHHFVEEMVRDDEVATPLVVAAAGRLLAATALATFPNTAGPRDGSPERSDHSPGHLHRAIAYMEDHVAEDVSVADIAAQVYLTPRALQYLFRRHLDTTPMAYLRRLRLDRVHHELVTGTRANTTVTSTAARWGFAHTGRFAVLYRETYGQSPHVTLRY